MTVVFARLLPALLAVLVGLVSARMAAKGLSATGWLPFHAAAAGTEWRDVAPRLRWVILFLVRAVGLGFLAVSLLLVLVVPPLCWRGDRAAAAILAVSAAYCAGLGALNRRLHIESGAATPWKGSFGAAAALGVAALLSLFSSGGP